MCAKSDLDGLCSATRTWHAKHPGMQRTSRPEIQKAWWARRAAPGTTQRRRQAKAPDTRSPPPRPLPIHPNPLYWRLGSAPNFDAQDRVERPTSEGGGSGVEMHIQPHVSSAERCPPPVPDGQVSPSPCSTATLRLWRSKRHRAKRPLGGIECGSRSTRHATARCSWELSARGGRVGECRHGSKTDTSARAGRERADRWEGRAVPRLAESVQ